MHSKSYDAGFKHGMIGLTDAYKPGNRKPGSDSFLDYSKGFEDGFYRAGEEKRRPGQVNYGRKNNPAPKKRALSRPSQVTKKSPTKRLVARRKIAAKKPVKGYFPNPGETSINRFPLEVQYYVPVNDNWITIAKLPAEYIELAKKVAKAAATETSFKIRVIKK